MAANKKTPTRKNTKSKKVSFGKRRISARNLLIFAIIFGLIGGYTLWRSYATDAGVLLATDVQLSRSTAGVKTVTETKSGTSKRDKTVVEIPSGATAVLATGKRTVKSGVYQVCANELVVSGTTTVTMYVYKYVYGVTGTRLGSVSASVSNSAEYSRTKVCANLTIDATSYVQANVKSSGSILHLGSVIFDRTGSITPPPNDWSPVGVTGTWTLDPKRSDEFDGSSLDTSKWSPSWFGYINGSTYSHPVNSSEDGCFDAKLVSVSGGNLRLGSGTNSDPNCELRDGTTAKWRGSTVSSNGKFAASTGYWESRIFFPSSKVGCGIYNWPVFWTDGQNWSNDGELDIAEVSSSHDAKWHVHSTLATQDGPSFCGGGTDPTNPAQWHIYGVKRTATQATFYYDGKNMGTASLNFTSPHYTILGMQIDEGHGVTVGPNVTMLVDYTRYWSGN